MHERKHLLHYSSSALIPSTRTNENAAFSSSRILSKDSFQFHRLSKDERTKRIFIALFSRRNWKYLRIADAYAMGCFSHSVIRSRSISRKQPLGNILSECLPRIDTFRLYFSFARFIVNYSTPVNKFFSFGAFTRILFHAIVYHKWIDTCAICFSSIFAPPL